MDNPKFDVKIEAGTGRSTYVFDDGFPNELLVSQSLDLDIAWFDSDQEAGEDDFTTPLVITGLTTNKLEIKAFATDQTPILLNSPGGIDGNKTTYVVPAGTIPSSLALFEQSNAGAIVIWSTIADANSKLIAYHRFNLFDDEFTGAGDANPEGNSLFDFFQESTGVATTTPAPTADKKALAHGDFSTAPRFGEQGYSGGGQFSTAGDAKYATFLGLGTTTDDTATEILLGGVAGERLTLLSGQMASFEAFIQAKEDATGDVAYMFGEGLIKNIAGTTTLLKLLKTTIFQSGSLALDFDIEADDGNDSIKPEAIGEIGKTLKWTFKFDLQEIT